MHLVAGNHENSVCFSGDVPASELMQLGAAVRYLAVGGVGLAGAGHEITRDSFGSLPDGMHTVNCAEAGGPKVVARWQAAQEATCCRVGYV